MRCRLRRMATNVLSGLRGGVVCAGWRLTSYPAYAAVSSVPDGD
ncbi:hypothetical protein [Salmonella bongori]|nr:hypothetical protein [Salmonella bongori]